MSSSFRNPAVIPTLNISFSRLVIFILCTSNVPIYAAEWKFDPKASLKAGYNDNLRLSVDNEISTAELTFSPRATFSVETPRSGLSGDVRFDFRRFEEDSGLDENNTRIGLDTYRTWARSRVGLELGLTNDSTLDTQLEETGLVFDREERLRWNLSPNWTYSLSERSNISARYTYNDVQYPETDDPRFIDYILHSAQLSLNRSFTPKTTATVSLSGTYSENDNDVISKNLGGGIGLAHQLSPTLSINMSGGVRNTEVEFEQNTVVPIFSGNQIIGFFPITQDISNSDWGFTYSARIAKAFLRGELGLSASQDISNDANGRPVEVTRIGTFGVYRLSETISSQLRVELYESETDNEVAGQISRSYRLIEPSLNWKFRRFWALSASYRYREQIFDDTDEDATQNAAYLTLTYHWPRIAVSR